MISFAASASNMENDTVEQARASNMEEDKATSPNKGKFIDVGNASDIEMATNILKKLDTEERASNMENDVEQERASNMEEEDKASSSNMEHDVEHERASNMEEDKAMEKKYGKKIKKRPGTYIVDKLDYEMLHMSTGRDGYEKRISPCCIYRVPKPLRNVNWKVYTPLLISIGPLHRGNKRLEAMEREKLKYFKKRLRSCYSEKFKKIESDDFVVMILLDAVFIIQFFLQSNFWPRMTYDIQEDLMLLENQLPLFIIQEIYDWATPHSQDAEADPFLDLATRHFRKYSLLKRTVGTSPSVEKSMHFTDLLRDFMLSGAMEPGNSISNPMLKYSAVMLRKAGVRFQVSQNKCLVNITFDKGVLEIPCLEIDHCFERLVRNIMALEQCCYPSDAYICSYIKFMDHLIDSAEDVRLLVGKGIIVHSLGDDAAVSNMINHLCENIGDNYTCFDYTCFGDISRKLNDHHARLFNRAMATLLLVYFPNFWRGTATLAAALLLILTFIQTLSSLKLFG